jgi:hypothetical protein
MRAAWSELSVDTDKIYQRIGEFVVCFQWLEHKFREIGWLILDPWPKEWPPKQLRKEGSEELIGKVESLFVDVIRRLDVPGQDERIQDFNPSLLVVTPCGSTATTFYTPRSLS